MLIAFLVGSHGGAIGALLPENGVVYLLDYADHGQVLPQHIQATGKGEEFDAVEKQNYPMWSNVTDDGLPVPVQSDGLIPSDGKALQIGESQGFTFRSAAEKGMDLSSKEFSLFVRLYRRSGGDLRISQSGSVELRWFTDQEIQPNRNQVAITVISEGSPQTIWIEESTSDLNRWRNYLVVLRNGEVLCYVDGALAASKALSGKITPNPNTPVKIESLSSVNEYIEALAWFPNGLAEELSAELTK